jgi:hypothetical protein
MNLRLFFLFPDREHALRAVNDLGRNGLDTDCIHTLARPGVSLHGLPESNRRQRADAAGRIEFWAWRANLAVFFLAALALALMVFQQAGLWLLLPLMVMVVSFVLGERFTHIPNTHLDEFRDALEHGEILLMIDTPTQRVDEIEYRMHRHHPEAVPGGSSWTLPALKT